MYKGLLKFADAMLAFALVGPLLAWSIGSLRAHDGDPRTTPLSSAEPAKGAAILALCVLAAGAVGVVSGRFFTRGRGVCIAGVCLAWAAFATGNIREVLGDPDGAAAVSRLLVEALILVPLVAVVALAIEAFSPVSAEELGHPHGPSFPPPGLAGIGRGMTVKSFAAALFAALAAAGVVGGLVAINPLKGQTLFAAFLAGIAGGWASGFAQTNTHSKDGGLAPPPSLVPALLAVAIVGIIGMGYVMTVGTSVVAGVRTIEAVGGGGLFGFGRILPLDWVAGGIFGVPVGTAWAASMIDRSKPHEAHA
jgi:hypothetical protein